MHLVTILRGVQGCGTVHFYPHFDPSKNADFLRLKDVFEYPDNPDNVDYRQGAQQMKTMSATTASKEFGLFLDTAQREPVIVTKKNRPVTVTLSYQDWEEMVTARIERGIEAGLADIEKGDFTEITPTSAEERIARFQKRAADSGS